MKGIRSSLVLYQSQSDVKSYMGFKRWVKMHNKHSLLPNTGQINYEIVYPEKTRSLQSTVDEHKKQNSIKRLPVSKGYAMQINRFTNVLFPKSVISSEHLEGNKDPFDYRFQLSFYHTKSRQFFGRTFVSEESTQSDIVGQMQHYVESNVQFNETIIYFHTPIIDPNVVIVCELIGLILNPQRDVVLREVSLGFSLLGVFATLQLGKLDPAFFEDHFDRDEGLVVANAPKTQKRMYKGTPRLLMACGEHELAKNGTCAVEYSFFRHKSLETIIGPENNLLQENDFYDENDSIPGLQFVVINDGEEEYEIPSLDSPVLEPHLPLAIRNLRLHLPEHLEEKIISDLETVRKKEQQDLIVMDKTVGVLKRRFRIGVHNTCTFVGPVREINLVPTSVRRVSENTEVVDQLGFNGTLEFSNFIDHPECALVMELEYVLSYPQPMKIVKKQKFLSFRKKEFTLRPEKDVFEFVVSVGYLIFLPFHRAKVGDGFVETEMMVATSGKTARSFFGNLMCVLPTNSSVGLSFKMEGVAQSGIDLSQTLIDGGVQTEKSTNDVSIGGDTTVIPKVIMKDHTLSYPEDEVLENHVKKDELSLKNIGENIELEEKKKNTMKDISDVSDGLRKLRPKLIEGVRRLSVNEPFGDMDRNMEAELGKVQFEKLPVNREMDTDGKLRETFVLQIKLMQIFKHMPSVVSFNVLFFNQRLVSNQVEVKRSSGLLVDFFKSSNGCIVNMSIDQNEVPSVEFEYFQKFKQSRCVCCEIFDQDRHFVIGYFIIPFTLFKQSEENYVFNIYNGLPDAQWETNYVGKVACSVVNIRENSKSFTDFDQSLKLSIDKRLETNFVRELSRKRVSNMHVSIDVSVPVESRSAHFEDLLSTFSSERKKKVRNTLGGLVEKSKYDNVTIFVTFGESQYFPVLLSNLTDSPKEYYVRINLSLSQSKCVTLKEDSRVKKLKDDEYSVRLNPNSTFEMVFRYYSIFVSAFLKKIDDFKIRIFSARENSLVKDVDVTVVKIPIVIDKQFEFHSPQDTSFRQLFHSPFKNIRVMTSNAKKTKIVPETSRGVNSFELFCDRSSMNTTIETHLLLYDAEDSNLQLCREIWKIRIRFLKSYMLKGYVGQRNTVQLKNLAKQLFPTRSAQSNSHVKAVSDNPDVMKAEVWEASAKFNVRILFSPMKMEKKNFVVNLVDQEAKDLVYSLLFMTAPSVKVKKRKVVYERVGVVGEESFFSIPFKNVYRNQNKFIVKTDRRDVIDFEKNQFGAKNNSFVDIPIKVFKQKHQHLAVVRVFVCDSRKETVLEYSEIKIKFVEYNE